jgi:hypothetical protein
MAKESRSHMVGTITVGLARDPGDGKFLKPQARHIRLRPRDVYPRHLKRQDPRVARRSTLFANGGTPWRSDSRNGRKSIRSPLQLKPKAVPCTLKVDAAG